VSKTEDALHEAELGGASAELAGDGELPAPRASGNGFAPPTPPESSARSEESDVSDASDGAAAPAGNGARSADVQVASADHVDGNGATARPDDDVELFDVELADVELAGADDGLPAPHEDVAGFWSEPDPELAALAGDPATDAAASDVGVEFDDVPADFVVTEAHGPDPTTIPGEALKVTPPGIDVLEELRRANIDGPTVEFAPQDDTTSAARRPHRLREYDPAPIPIPAKVPRLLGRKPRVRKVTRVVRHVDPWSVFKIAIIANAVLYVIALTSGVLLWNVANATGTVDNVERFFESFGWTSFDFNGGEIYHSAWIAGLFLVIGLTGVAVLCATLFNLITDLVGGMRFTVLEEEVVETRTSPMRRFVVRRAEPEVPAVDHDDSGAIIREAVVDDSGAIVRRTR
jgi:hypothetical protein